MGTLVRFREDERVRSKAAASARRSALTASMLGRVDGKSRVTGSRMMAGHPSSIHYKAIVHVRNLAVCDGTSPYPFIATLMQEAKAGLETRATDALVRRFYELQDKLQPEANVRAVIASRGEDTRAYMEALMHDAELRVEMASILEVLQTRNVDYRHYRPDGSRLIRPIR